MQMLTKMLTVLEARDFSTPFTHMVHCSNPSSPAKIVKPAIRCDCGIFFVYQRFLAFLPLCVRIIVYAFASKKMLTQNTKC